MSAPSISPLQLYISNVAAPSVKAVLVSTAWAAMLIPLLGILFFLSTPSIRKQPIFVMNIFTVTMGILLGIINIKLYVTVIINPLAGLMTTTVLAYIGMISIMPIIIDCILAYRLTAVYPWRVTSNYFLAIVFVPVVSFKVARLINITILMVMFSRGVLDSSNSQSGSADFGNIWNHTPYVKIEWILQVVDNCYASSHFLWQLWLGQSRQKRFGQVGTVASTATPRANKIKHLFYFALSSFAFPCVFSIIQVGIAFHNQDFFIASYIFVTNLYFEIICVLFATIWATKTHAETHGQHNQSYSTDSSIAYYRSGETSEIYITQQIDISTTPNGTELNGLERAKK